MSDCGHCPHYNQLRDQLYSTAIDLDEIEQTAHVLRTRLQAAGEALLWCLPRVEQPPAWVRAALDEAETPI